MSGWKIIPAVQHYFVRCTITDWCYVFTEIRYFDIVIDALKFCIANKGLQLHGYVIMPNHVHYILSTSTETLLSDVLRDLNRFTSKAITEQLEADHREELLRTFRDAARADGRGNTFKVWQEGFHPIVVDEEDIFIQKLEYVHDNPVRKGFVEAPEHWLYSSARNYLLDDHSVIRVELLV